MSEHDLEKAIKGLGFWGSTSEKHLWQAEALKHAADLRAENAELRAALRQIGGAVVNEAGHHFQFENLIAGIVDEALSN